jgi:long-chain acyl-CoA synthetase
MTWLRQMDTAPLFKVLYVPPEIKERALEPMTSVKAETGADLSLDSFKEVLVRCFGAALKVDFEEGKLTRDEVIAYEKNRALSARI